MSCRILIGDVRERLRELPDESVHCVVTSPPYWSLRDYGTAEWEGGDAGCDHDTSKAKPRDLLGSDGKPGKNCTSWSHRDATATAGDCPKCGARRVDSQLGLEPTPEEHVERMVEVFREVRRVMRGDASLWLNYGDAFRDKQLLGLPWRIAFALQADGFYLRSDIIFAKANPMPESVTDRPTKSHEYVFLLSKSARYFYDADAVREITGNEATFEEQAAGSKGWGDRMAGNFAGKTVQMTHPNGRNLRDVWTIPTAPFPGAHFATFPPKLVEPCIKAGTSEHGCCAECGAPWGRQLEVTYSPGGGGGAPSRLGDARRSPDSRNDLPKQRATRHSATTAWSPGCDCAAAVVPCTVLDPFGGAGTVGLVADRLGRESILIELNPGYAEMARKRIREDCPLFANVACE